VFKQVFRSCLGEV